jgi:Fe-only nitrogenase accessory protein AnfO
MCQKRTDRKGPEIATILDGSGCSSDLSEPGTIVVFQKQGCSFEAVREMEFAIHQCVDLRDLRQKVAELLEFMGNCRIFVARSVHGALYFELEKAGISTWEVSGRPEDFLGQVWNDDETDKVTSEPAAGFDIPVPEQRAPGYFYISIKDIQGKRPEVSSKQVLREFIRSGSFSVIEIICDHVPPWIEMEAECGSFMVSSEQVGKNATRVMVVKRP